LSKLGFAHDYIHQERSGVKKRIQKAIGHSVSKICVPIARNRITHAFIQQKMHLNLKVQELNAESIKQGFRVPNSNSGFSGGFRIVLNPLRSIDQEQKLSQLLNFVFGANLKPQSSSEKAMMIENISMNAYNCEDANTQQPDFQTAIQPNAIQSI
jgi:hypothetical protein